MRKSPKTALAKIEELKTELTEHSDKELLHKIEILYYRGLMSIGKYNATLDAIDKNCKNLSIKDNNEFYIDNILYKNMAYFLLDQIDNFNKLLNENIDILNKIKNHRQLEMFKDLKIFSARINKKHQKVIDLTNKLLLEENNNKSIVWFVNHYHNIALSYILLKKYDDALCNLEKAKNKLLNTTEHYYIILNLLNTTKCLRLMKNIALAHKTIIRAEAYSKTYKFSLFNAFINSELAHIHFENKDYKTTIEYSSKSIEYFEKNNVKDINFAKTKLLMYKCQVVFEEYCDILNEGEEMVNLIETFNDKELEIEIFNIMYTIYISKNDILNAKIYLEKISAISV